LTKPLRFSVTLPAALSARVLAASEARGLTPAQFTLAMLAWHAPGADNAVQQLKDKVKERASHGDDYALRDILTLVRT
jgi:hypothetical protein